MSDYCDAVFSFSFFPSWDHSHGTVSQLVMSSQTRTSYNHNNYLLLDYMPCLFVCCNNIVISLAVIS